MPQVIHVVCCVSCKRFQTQIVKQSSNKKWVCKVCEAKQSLQTVFAEGAGAYCREVVQKLNLTLGQSEDQEKVDKFDQPEASNYNCEFEQFDKLEQKEIGNSVTVSQDTDEHILAYQENRSSGGEPLQQLLGGKVLVVDKSQSRWTKYEDSQS